MVFQMRTSAFLADIKFSKRQNGCYLFRLMQEGAINGILKEALWLIVNVCFLKILPGVTISDPHGRHFSCKIILTQLFSKGNTFVTSALCACVCNS